MLLSRAVLVIVRCDFNLERVFSSPFGGEVIRFTGLMGSTVAYCNFLIMANRILESSSP